MRMHDGGTPVSCLTPFTPAAFRADSGIAHGPRRCGGSGMGADGFAVSDQLASPPPPVRSNILTVSPPSHEFRWLILSRYGA